MLICWKTLQWQVQPRPRRCCPDTHCPHLSSPLLHLLDHADHDCNSTAQTSLRRRFVSAGGRLLHIRILASLLCSKSFTRRPEQHVSTVTATPHARIRNRVQMTQGRKTSHPQSGTYLHLPLQAHLSRQTSSAKCSLSLCSLTYHFSEGNSTPIKLSLFTAAEIKVLRN